MANGFFKPLRYEYQPINYAAYAEPLMRHQQAYDQTMAALDTTAYDIAHMTQDNELVDKMEKGLQGDLDKISNELLSNADYRTAARKLNKLNKFYNSDDHINAVRSSYAAEQALIEKLDKGIEDDRWDENYKQMFLANERNKFKGTKFKDGRYNVFSPGATYKDYTEEIKEEVNTLLSKNPADLQEYVNARGLKLNDWEYRGWVEAYKNNDYNELLNIAQGIVMGDPRYMKSIQHRAGLEYDYLAIDNPEWAAELYGKQTADFDAKIANAKTDAERNALTAAKTALQEGYAESQGDYYKSLYAQQMVNNLVSPIALNYAFEEHSIKGGFTYSPDPVGLARAKKAAEVSVENLLTTPLIQKTNLTDVSPNNTAIEKSYIDASPKEQLNTLGLSLDNTNKEIAKLEEKGKKFANGSPEQIENTNQLDKLLAQKTKTEATIRNVASQIIGGVNITGILDDEIKSARADYDAGASAGNPDPVLKEKLDNLINTKRRLLHKLSMSPSSFIKELGIMEQELEALPGYVDRTKYVNKLNLDSEENASSYDIKSFLTNVSDEEYQEMIDNGIISVSTNADSYEEGVVEDESTITFDGGPKVIAFNTDALSARPKAPDWARWLAGTDVAQEQADAAELEAIRAKQAERYGGKKITINKEAMRNYLNYGGQENDFARIYENVITNFKDNYNTRLQYVGSSERLGFAIGDKQTDKKYGNIPSRVAEQVQKASGIAYSNQDFKASGVTFVTPTEEGWSTTEEKVPNLSFMKPYLWYGKEDGTNSPIISFTYPENLTDGNILDILINSGQVTETYSGEYDSDKKNQLIKDNKRKIESFRKNDARQEYIVRASNLNIGDLSQYIEQDKATLRSLTQSGDIQNIPNIATLTNSISQAELINSNDMGRHYEQLALGILNNKGVPVTVGTGEFPTIYGPVTTGLKINYKFENGVTTAQIIDEDEGVIGTEQLIGADLPILLRTMDRKYGTAPTQFNTDYEVDPNVNYYNIKR